MKLLLLPQRGAYGRRDLILYRHLTAAGIEPLFIYDTAARDHTLNGETLPRQVIPMRGRFDIASILQLRRVVRGFAPDIIHAYTAKAGWLAVAAQWPIKHARLVLYRGAIRNLNRWSPSDRLLFFSRWVDGYECICQAVADSLAAQGVRSNRSQVIFPGFLVEGFQKNASFRPIESGTAKRIRIGCIANYRRIKGLEYLVAAADRLLEKGVDFELVFVGRDEGGKLASCVAGSKAHGRIQCLGFAPNPISILRTFDVTVVPSLSEGLCKVAVESMACGVPVVATNVGGLPEVLEHGETGLLVEPANVEAIAAAIIDLMANPQLREQFREKGLRTFNERFSMEGRAEQLVDFYRRLVPD